MSKFDLSKTGERQDKLKQIAAELKQEFFGLDEIIDRIIDSVQSWYVLPELVTRPVIVNLWGLTGVGKTQVVRSLVKKLGLTDKFLEIQMDGSSEGSNYNYDSLTKILEESPISEGEYGIVLLDEFQRFRTIDALGNEMPVKRFQDLWMLLSDGKFSVDYTKMLELELLIVNGEYQMEDWYMATDASDEEKAKQKKKMDEREARRKWKIHSTSAKMYKKLLKLREPVRELMTWPKAKFSVMLEEALNSSKPTEIDYSKLLVFICGNLDEAFRGLANRLADCDTDADIYHRETKKVSVISIKNALRSRFRPQQIARLGSNHVIYPSLSKSSYEKLIRSTCLKYVDRIKQETDIHIYIEEDAYKIIYENSVYPTQGTRPVFSSIHSILSSSLSRFTFWAVKNNYPEFTISITQNPDLITATYGDNEMELPILLEIKQQKQKNSIDFNTMVAVHEAGHALVQALLTKRAPDEIKINIASFKGGFNMIESEESSTKIDIENKIAVYLAGTIAEEIVFGTNVRSTGNFKDLESATAFAASYVRCYGFDGKLSYITPQRYSSAANYDLDATNQSIENILQTQKSVVSTLITANITLLKKIVARLLETSMISSDDFVELSKEYIPDITSEISDVNLPYKNMWDKFIQHHE